MKMAGAGGASRAKPVTGHRQAAADSNQSCRPAHQGALVTLFSDHPGSSAVTPLCGR